ncbi:MAG: VOC family protein [Actinobacteria bacterium]|nr:VOC family protein [Actinomycetota bacterium]
MEHPTTPLVTTPPVKGEHRGLLPDALRLGPAHLIVSDLNRSIDWYERVIGLRLRERASDVDGATAALGTGEPEDVLVLHEHPGARVAAGHAGLYHVALLYPSRIQLAGVGQRIAEARAPIQGASDHGTHEAFYLADPDYNGLELAADRPLEQWPDFTKIEAIRPQSLDVGGLFNLTSGRELEPHAEPGLVVGHVHLHVGDVDEAQVFYRDVIGFDLIAKLDSAAFVSAGGYHHHLAFNIWQGHGALPPPPDSVGLHHWTIELPAVADVHAVRDRVGAAGYETVDLPRGFAVRDPWRIALHVVAAD